MYARKKMAKPYVPFFSNSYFLSEEARARYGPCYAHLVPTNYFASQEGRARFGYLMQKLQKEMNDINNTNTTHSNLDDAINQARSLGVNVIGAPATVANSKDEKLKE